MLLRTLLLAIISTGSVALAQSPVTRQDQVTCSTKGASGRLAACQKIAKAGDAAAFAYLFEIYDEGDGVAKDLPTAFSWKLKYANSGDKNAMASAAISYFDGTDGAPKDLGQSLFWARKSAEAGSVGGQWFLGRHLLKGDGYPQNTTEGLAWLNKSAEQGFEHAQYSILSYAAERRTPENLKIISAWAPRMVNSNDALAISLLGQLYYSGAGVERDVARAKTLLRRGADAGSASSQTLYANYFLAFPEDGRRDLAAARSFLTKAWAQDYTLAGIRLAELDIYEGKWKQDPTSFRNLLEKIWTQIEDSCSKGLDCQYETGKLIAIAREMGIGGSVDLKGAKDVYAKQLKRGHQGTESSLSEGNPWMPRGTRRFWQKSLLTDAAGPFSEEQKRELSISFVKDVTPNVSTQGATRPVLEFDIQVFISASVPVSDALVLEHVEAAAKYMKTCDVRLRKARVWRDKSGSDLEKIRKISQPLINVYFGETDFSSLLLGGTARSSDKTIQVNWQVGKSEVGGESLSGGGSNILAHELAHVFELPHPNKLNASPMQYGWLAHLDPKFGDEECELIRKHELLSPPGGTTSSQASADNGVVVDKTNKTSSVKSSPQNSAMNVRYETAFNDLRALILKSNTSPFSRFTLNAIAIKNDIPWNDTVNLMQAASSWRNESSFSAARDFKAGQPANIQNLDKVFDKRGNLTENLEHTVGTFRKQTLESDGLKLGSLFENGRISLRAGQVFNETVPSVSVISEDENYNLYLVGGDLFVVEPKTKIIFAVRKDLINLVKDENTPAIWTKRDSGIFEETDIMKMSRYGGAKPTAELMPGQGYTPQSIPGGQVISADEVTKVYQAAANGGPKPLIASALNSAMKLPLAYVFSQFAVPGSFDDDLQKQLAVNMAPVAKDRFIVTYCHHSACWLSYYLSLRLIALGFTNVHWMREGLEGWVARDYPLALSKQ